MKKVFETVVLCVVILALVALQLAAQDKPAEPKKATEASAPAPKPAPLFVPTFAATLFAHYQYVLQGTDGPDFNKFDMERMYFTVKTAVAEDWKLQMTTDIYRNAAAGSYYAGLAVRLKFGYLDYAPMNGLSLKFGMIPTAWNSTEETVWRYRGIDKTVSDKYSYFSTADLGVSATYALPDKYGEVAAYMMNGEGFSAIEANRYKDYTVRATVSPLISIDELKSFSVSGLASIGATGTTRALQKDRYGVLVGYSYSFISIGGEYDVRKDAPTHPDTVKTGKVVSVVAEVRLPFAGLESKLSVIARFDAVEPNVDKGGDMTHFLIAGLVYKVSDKLAIAIDHQAVAAETKSLKRTDGVMIDNDRRWFLHTILTF
jgi:hypothetical protein